MKSHIQIGALVSSAIFAVTYFWPVVSCSGAQIPIVNPSFESQTLSDGAWIDGILNGWTVGGHFAGPQNFMNNSYPGASDFDGIPSTIPDGRNVAFLRVPNKSISQMLDATLQPNTTYDLRYSVGHGAANQFPRYRAELLAGTTVLAVDDTKITPGPGIWLPSSVSFTSGVTSSLFGEPLGIRFQSYGANDPVGCAGCVQVHIDDVGLTAEALFQTPLQRVVLSWEEDVPVRVRKTIFNIYVDDEDDTMPASDLRDSSNPTIVELRSDILQRVRQAFKLAGVENIEILDSPTPEATTIYFTSDDVGLAGRAFTGVDRFNRNLRGGGVVFLSGTLGDAEDIAETAAHEIGHLFGLRHVRPRNLPEIMESGAHDEDDDVFNNTVSPISDDGSSDSHNPIYHLRRYLDGKSHESLSGSNVSGGTYDQGIIEYLLTRFDFGNSSSLLHNVAIYAGETETRTKLISFDQISFAELSNLDLIVEQDVPLLFMAASQPTIEADLVLATGNPADEANHLISPHLGSIVASLQQYSPIDGGFVTLQSVDVVASLVPEPTTLIYLTSCLPLLFSPRYRRRSHKVSIG